MGGFFFDFEAVRTTSSNLRSTQDQCIVNSDSESAIEDCLKLTKQFEIVDVPPLSELTAEVRGTKVQKQLETPLARALISSAVVDGDCVSFVPDARTHALALEVNGVCKVVDGKVVDGTVVDAEAPLSSADDEADDDAADNALLADELAEALLIARSGLGLGLGLGLG